MKRTLAHLAALSLAVSAMSTSAYAAMSCSARHKVCLNYCAKNYPNQQGCTVNCGNALPQCQQSGCWVTPQENKCGYAKS